MYDHLLLTNFDTVVLHSFIHCYHMYRVEGYGSKACTVVSIVVVAVA